MKGLGTLVNVAAVLLGGAAGLVLKRMLAKRVTQTVMQGVGLAVVIIGLSGALGAAFTVADGKISSSHILLMIISLALGGLAGEFIRVEERLEALGRLCQNKLAKADQASTFAQGFVTACLVFCVGSMAIVGALEDGIWGRGDILFAKAALDGITAMIFASTMGVGVLFSAVVVGVYQGGITLLSVLVSPYLSETLMAQMALIGSVLIMAIGLNLLQISKIKTGNLLPAILVPVLYNIALALVG